MQLALSAQYMKLMTHVVVGYPTLEATVQLVKTMVKQGVDMVELQIPFSDPLADGPTIMKACEESLRNGTTVADAFRIMEELTEYFKCHQHVILGMTKGRTPESRKDSGRVRSSLARMTNEKEVSTNNPRLLFMCYYNTIFNFGTEKFIKKAKEVGCDGLIVPDMPLEEEAQENFYAYCKKYEMSVIFVVSPVSSDTRLQAIARSSGSGQVHSVSSEQASFVYATARQGTTGVQRENQESRIKNQELLMFLKRVKKYFDIPIAVGFGISTKEQIEVIQGYADIAVVGSAIIEVVNSSENIQKGVEDFLSKLKMVE